MSKNEEEILVIAGISILVASAMGFVMAHWKALVAILLIFLLICLLAYLWKKGYLMDAFVFLTVGILAVAVIGMGIYGAKAIVDGIIDGTREYSRTHSPEYLHAEKTESLGNLKANLESQIARISGGKRQYANDIAEYRGEIKREMADNQIKSIETATARIRFNIKLIQERDAFIAKLSEYESNAKDGIEEATYLLRQLSAAKTMSEITSNGQTLAGSVAETIDKYELYSKSPVLHPKDLQVKSAEVIWETYVR
jgi:energy-coupling factor transporter transmembrane protein EcfT